MVRGLIPFDPRSAPRRIRPRRRSTIGCWRRAAIRSSPARTTPTDRIFVHDFVLPVRIGAYARERDQPQQVALQRRRARCRVAGHAAEDMRDVFSYDIITDGIRVIVAHEHIALVETLAERIAAFVLAHPRVARVTVRVEKLDVGPGGVGVEITRERPAEVAKVHQLYPVAAARERPESRP